MSKAWGCCNEEWCITEVVFADTIGKAKSYFISLETFDYYGYIDIRPYRVKQLDHLNHSDGYVMDWKKDEDRIPMVRDAAFSCYEVNQELCEVCCAKEWCKKFKEVKNE